MRPAQPLRVIAMTVVLALVTTLTMTMALPGCNGGREPERTATSDADRAALGDATLSVYTVNYPLAYFAERIGGDSVDVRFPAPTGVDPAYWSPEPAIVTRYQTADVILLNGAGYARWTKRATLPRATLVDTSAAFTDSLIEIDAAPTHTHGPGGEHSHAELAFTTWLDPQLALQQAEAIEKALAARRPTAAGEMAERAARLREDLESIDERIIAVAGNLRRAGVLYSHPVYQYLDRRYALNGRAFHWEPGENPSRAQWATIERAIEGRAAAVMLWEGEPLPETQRRLDRLGVESIVFPTLANPGAGADYVDDINTGIDRIVATSGAG